MSLNVLLVNPNLIDSPSHIPGQNVGLSYIISAVEHRHSAYLLDTTFHVGNYRRYIEEALKGYMPHVVGFSSPTYYYTDSLKIAKLLRTLYPDRNIPFIWGGVHPTLFPEETLSHPLVDALCIGEGERTVQQYLDKMEAGKEPIGVPGLWYKDRKGNIVRNRLRHFEEDLDSLPFPSWDHWEIEKYMDDSCVLPGSLRHMFSRGCPYSCTFCALPILKRKNLGRCLRHRSPENLIEEIKRNHERYSSKGFKSVYISDETFGIDKGIFDRFCNLYRSERLDKTLPFLIQTRADIVDRQWVEKISMAGCRMVYLGVESANDYIRNRVYKKNISRQDIINACRYLRDAGIPFRLGFVLDTSRADRSIIKEDVQLIKETKPLFFYYGLFNPIPQVPLTEEMKKQGLLKDKAYKESWDMRRFGLEKSRYKKIMRMLNMTRMLKVRMYIKEGFRRRGFRLGIEFLNFVFKFIRENNTLSLKRLFYDHGIESDLVLKPVFYDYEPEA